MTSPLPIVGYINPLVADALRDPTSGINVTQLRAERNGCVSAPLVLKTDADAEIARLQKIVGVFSAKIAEYASEGWDVPAPECVDLLDEAGVIEWGTFDPQVHDCAMFDGCEAGDPIWSLKGPEA
ncbi:hypothetical protein [Acetobacter senegalensis]|uniref:hypothetical protein n=1 Tax=Acetobacter senegalensis TaxID=446692 RepID=UPI00265570AA|nr:hypothetical protein [Acetobacter senegalensis]MDN7356356.1 hypothetical protein [Acetobacter senegalensis]